jgi:hypothetical protein
MGTSAGAGGAADSGDSSVDDTADPLAPRGHGKGSTVRQAAQAYSVRVCLLPPPVELEIALHSKLVSRTYTWWWLHSLQWSFASCN